MNRRRIQPRPAVELETDHAPPARADLVRAVDDYAKHLGGSTDRTYVITKAIELAIEPRRRLPQGPLNGSTRRQPPPAWPSRTVIRPLTSAVPASEAHAVSLALAANTPVFTRAGFSLLRRRFLSANHS